jgi:dienelactone hydrolase
VDHENGLSFRFGQRLRYCIKGTMMHAEQGKDCVQQCIGDDMPTNAFSIARAALSLTFVLAAVGIAVDPAHAQQDGVAAWSAGKLYVPVSLSITSKACESPPAGKCAADIKPGKNPVIVYLHGCGGLKPPRPLLDLGAIVVAPNSFAGGAACKPDGKYMAQFLKRRHGDVSYAVNQIKAAAWADPEKMVLAGFSNGAQSAATYPGGEFKARAIVAWTCNNAHAPDQNGVRGSGPVLAVLSTADSFFKKAGISGNCAESVKGRGEGSQSILIPGGNHEILDHATTRAALAKFIPPVIR